MSPRQPRLAAALRFAGFAAAIAALAVFAVDALA
jgi:hypothetical protein